MRIKTLLGMIGCLLLMMGCAATTPQQEPEVLRQQVENTERAFARTMADRDHEAFVSFLSDEAVFFSGPTPTSGKQQVAALWKGLYEGPDAPFSWEPEQVVVLDSGTLALSTGPVRDPNGKLIATFTSIWRLGASGKWRIIFDKGSEVCDCSKP